MEYDKTNRRGTARATLGICAVALLGLAFVSTALAGPPVHPRLSALDISGLNHACGVAVDSEGDVYVASAGESKVKVFDPGHTELTSIADANEPCGLAVDTRGDLFVSEKGTGKVVRYVPDEYPFSGAPTYGSPETIDASGNAKGIAVDTSQLFTNSHFLIGGDDSLYIAKGDHIDAYRNETQRLEVNETGGTYKLKFNGQETAALPYNATHAEVQAALEALSTVGEHNVSVTTANFLDTQHLLTFTHKLGLANVSPIEVDATNLTGGGVSKSETNGGLIATNIGAGNLTDATGLAAYTYRIGSQESGQADRYVYAADAAGDEVKVLSGPSLESLKLRRTISGPKAGEDFGFGAAGAYLAADSSNGHFFAYDDAHSVVDEFEADGEFLDQVKSTEFADAEPTGIAVFPDRNEIQRVVAGCTGGTYTLGFAAETTAPIPCQATAAQVKEALIGLPAVGVEDISVNLMSAGEFARNYNIIFQGALGSRDVEELKADGSGLTGGASKAVIFFEAQGSGPGRLYVSAGAGAKLLAFGPLAAPSRSPRPELSRELKTAGVVAIDLEGNVYVAAGALVHVFSPAGKEIKVGPQGEGIPIAAQHADDLAVDSDCNVYVLVNHNLGVREKEKVQYYTPGSCPLKDGTQYSGPVTVADGNSFPRPTQPVTAIGINPGDDPVDPGKDHIFVANLGGEVIKLGSAEEGSPILNPCFACSLNVGIIHNIAAYGANGDVYISGGGGEPLRVVNPAGTEVLNRITGAGSPQGPFFGSPGTIAVDQSNGHVLAFDASRVAAEEYDASGAFVTQFGEFTATGINLPAGIAIDNSGGPGGGNVYIAFDESAPNTPDIWAFGPLAYGERPVALTGIADGIGAGKATPHGTVDPRGFDLTACKFEYVSEAAFKATGFSDLSSGGSKPCIPGLVEIGKGIGAVAVHATTDPLGEPEARYRFRLVAENKYGESEGKVWLFGPPLLTTKNALPVLYDEATLRAEVDPSGLATKYHFEYVDAAAYQADIEAEGAGHGFDHAQSTPEAELPPGDGFIAVQAPLTGLAEGTEYHFRTLVENEAKTVPGPEQTFATLERLKSPPCPNTEYRIGLSAHLPDCRAYELVTPAETRGARPHAEVPGNADQIFNNWLVAPRGEGAGESLAYFTYTTLPGFEGTGEDDGYRARRAPGLHPEAGWSNQLLSPSFAQQGGERSQQHGIAADQRYGFFDVSGQGALEHGKYLRTPSGLEPIGQGSLGTDLEAEGRFLSPGGAHVIFFSKKHLEPEGGLEGTVSVYDRAAGASSAEVVSVKPDGSAFGAGENAAYVGATEDGSAVLFEVGGALYLHRAGATTEIAAAPNTFAGVSEDGERIFYADAVLSITFAQPAGLYVCDVEAGPCAGPGAHPATGIASNAVFVNVSPDGSHVFFTSEDALTGTEENEAGETAEAGQPNLYAWDGAATRFLAVLDPKDVEPNGFADFVDLRRWTRAISAGVEIGRGKSPTRSTPAGEVFVFQSHAKLTAYDNEGSTEVYRYDPAAPSGERMLCVSCAPSGAPPDADAQLLSFGTEEVTMYSTLVPNVTDNGGAVFFQSADPLLPEDANEVTDVYEWKARGSTGCERPGGCLALISSGQGEQPSLLYGMSADGHDVFFETREKLVGADVPGSPSLYDARIEGGIPDPPTPAPCQGDACQGTGSLPPSLPGPASTGSGEGNVEPKPKLRCPKGKRRVEVRGKSRCVKRPAKKRHHRRANHKRRGRR